MLKSPLLKYVASPQMFAYMPPILGGAAICLGMMLWFMAMIAGFTIIIGLVVGIVGCIAAAVAGFKDPHISNLLLARQKFMKKTPGILPDKGKHYVG